MQGAEALIGIVNLRLKLAVLLLEGILLMAKGIVIGRFPEHAGIGDDAGEDGGSADDGQHDKQVQRIEGHAKPAHSARVVRSNKEREMLDLHRLLSGGSENVRG